MKSVEAALLGLLPVGLKADTWERPCPVTVSSPSKRFIAQIIPRERPPWLEGTGKPWRRGFCNS
jgi:hypothetical protein